MNVENIKYCIELMKRAENLDMCDWQATKIDRFDVGNLEAEQKVVATSIQQLHACGNTACFAGYVALSEKFRNDGGSFTVNDGKPIFVLDAHEILYGSDAIAHWLGISYELASKLVFGYREFNDYFEVNDHESFYRVEFQHVKPCHVIEKLEQILAGELVY